MNFRTFERQFDRFWNGLLLTALCGSLVTALGAYLLPTSCFSDGAKMREGMIAAASFLFLILCLYLSVTGIAKEMYRALMDSLHRRRKRRHPQTEEERAYAEGRSCVLPDLPPALLRERLNAWVKADEENILLIDTEKEWAGGRYEKEPYDYINAAFEGEDFVLALTLEAAENDFSPAEQKKLIPAELHAVWKEMLLPWEPMDCPVTALIIRHGGETRLYPDVLKEHLSGETLGGIFR